VSEDIAITPTATVAARKWLLILYFMMLLYRFLNFLPVALGISCLRQPGIAAAIDFTAFTGFTDFTGFTVFSNFTGLRISLQGVEN
jgi:hypothetical protein